MEKFSFSAEAPGLSLCSTVSQRNRLSLILAGMMSVLSGCQATAVSNIQPQPPADVRTKPVQVRSSKPIDLTLPDDSLSDILKQPESLGCFPSGIVFHHQEPEQAPYIQYELMCEEEGELPSDRAFSMAKGPKTEAFPDQPDHFMGPFPESTLIIEDGKVYLSFTIDGQKHKEPLSQYTDDEYSFVDITESFDLRSRGVTKAAE